MIPIIIDTKINIVNIEAEDFLNFNFKLKKLTIGCPMRDIIAAIKIYPSNTLISNNKYAVRIKAEINRKDLTKFFENSFLSIYKYITY